MKRIVLAVLFLACAVALLPAQGFSYMGVGGGYTGQQVTSTSTLDLVNVNVQFASFYGKSLGLLTSVSFGTNVLASYKGTSINLSGFDFNLVMDSLFGLGYRFPTGKTMAIIVGGGLYMGVMMLEAEDYTSSTSFEDMAIGVGPGIGADFGYWIGQGIFLSANVMAGYGMIDLMGDLGGMSGNGLRVCGGVGLGFAY
jgi:hypothetical protein